MNRLRMLLILTALMTAGSAMASAEEYHHEGQGYRQDDRFRGGDRDDKKYLRRDRDDRYKSYDRDDRWNYKEKENDRGRYDHQGRR